MTKRKTWTAAAVLMSAMLVLTSACSSSKGGSPSSSPSSSAAVEAITDFAKQPEITLDVFSNLANFEGNQPGWFAKLVKDKFNIKLNIISGGQSKLNTLMAAGDLGDIAVAVNYDDPLKAGLLLDWKKNGLLDKYGKDILKYAGQVPRSQQQAIRRRYGDLRSWK